MRHPHLPCPRHRTTPTNALTSPVHTSTQVAQRIEPSLYSTLSTKIITSSHRRYSARYRPPPIATVPAPPSSAENSSPRLDFPRLEETGETCHLPYAPSHRTIPTPQRLHASPQPCSTHIRLWEPSYLSIDMQEPHLGGEHWVMGCWCIREMVWVRHRISPTRRNGPYRCRNVCTP